MADITVVGARPCTPAGYEFNDVAESDGGWAAGDLLVYTGDMSGSMAVMEKAAADATRADGIALQAAADGDRGCDVGIVGEMDGFSGLTPGTALFVSADNAGKIGTTAPTLFATTPAVTAPSQVRAVTDTRVRYSFL